VFRRRTGEGCRCREGDAGSGIIASAQQKISKKRGLLEREVLSFSAHGAEGEQPEEAAAFPHTVWGCG